MKVEDLKKLLEETDDKLSIFLDIEKINQYNLRRKEIANLINNFLSAEELYELYKQSILEKYQYAADYTAEDLKEILLNGENLNKGDKLTILSSTDAKTLSEFLINNEDFYKKSDIDIYEIIINLPSKEQKDFVEMMENIELPLDEKRRILAILNEDVKQSLNTIDFPEEYRTAITMKFDKISTRILFLDMERDLNDYKGLDNLIKVNPEDFTEEEKDRFKELCRICPNLEVVNTLDSGRELLSSAIEYINAEEWMSSVINSIPSKYSEAQKLAIIDNAIGNKISYSPDFDTEVYNYNDNNALWRIINTGYGVCGGIAKVEQYMLRKVGVESELVGSSNHAFLKIKDIELSNENNEFVKGNTIVDVTWNLVAHKFGGDPNCFCISYDVAREQDVDELGKDYKAHKNDEALQDATLNMDSQTRRNLFKSIGLTKNNGQFPVKSLVENSRLMDQLYAEQQDENINGQFLLLTQFLPDFATCQQESMQILKDVLLNNENLKFDKCVINRVYNRQDKDKRPVMYVYIESDKLGKKFYFADKDSRQFVELSPEEFEKQFECYRMDLEKNNRN